MLKKINEFVLNVFKLKSGNIYIQFFRYFIVSGIALIIDFSLTIVLTEYFKVYYLISSISGNILGLIVNYILNVYWVFNKRKIKNRFFEIILFVLTSFAGMIVGQFIVWFFTDVIRIYYVISKIVSVFFSYIVRFILRKIFIF